MNKPRKQTYTMEMLLKRVGDDDIRNDWDTQRNFIWTKEQINELTVTVLMGDYIPPIILGEENSSQLWIVDGGQRTCAFKIFRYGNYKITSAIENSIIPYRKKVRDEEGNVMRDDDGNIIWEETSFDIKNKTYDQLPDELKKAFDEYQVETVIHEHCDSHRISQLIQRYNNHASMNTNQKAFTYIDKFARNIRDIIGKNFFKDHSNYSENEKNKGVVERVITETVMCTHYLDDWKKQSRAICSYLNKNAKKEDFDNLAENISRLEKVITKEVKDVFNSKDSFIFLTLFDRFKALGYQDVKFAEFLLAFKEELVYKEVNGELFNEADKGKGTKDKAVIIKKLEILETLLHEFLGIEEEDFTDVDVLEFVKENVNPEITSEDIECYEECLEDYKLNSCDSRLDGKHNLPSLIAIVAYGFIHDSNLGDWFKEFFNKNGEYSVNQKQNYILMKKDLDKFAA